MKKGDNRDDKTNGRHGKHGEEDSKSGSMAPPVRTERKYKKNAKEEPSKLSLAPAYDDTPMLSVSSEPITKKNGDDDSKIKASKTVAFKPSSALKGSL